MLPRYLAQQSFEQPRASHTDRFPLAAFCSLGNESSLQFREKAGQLPKAPCRVFAIKLAQVDSTPCIKGTKICTFRQSVEYRIGKFGRRVRNPENLPESSTFSKELFRTHKNRPHVPNTGPHIYPEEHWGSFIGIRHDLIPDSNRCMQPILHDLDIRQVSHNLCYFKNT